MIHAQDYFDRGQPVRTVYGDVHRVMTAWESAVILDNGELLHATKVFPVEKIRGRWRPVPLRPIMATLD